MKFKKNIDNIPDKPGVYIMKNRRGDAIYVGKAKSIKKRVASYFSLKEVSPRHMALLNNLQAIDYLVTRSEKEAILLENELIKYFKPRYNVSLRDDKTYPYLKITWNEPFPRFLITRRREKDGSEYLGPYPDSGSLRQTLRTLSRIFPILLCRPPTFKARTKDRNPSRCLFYHIKQCLAPCIGNITEREYRKIINRAVMFLKGEGEELLKRLDREMRQAAKKLEFEKARMIKREIDAVQSIGERINFRQVEREKLKTVREARSLLLSVQQTLRLTRLPYRIEAFDISQFSGKEAVGSMVVFINARPAREEYRKYRIRGVHSVDDVAMIEEVVNRRYERVIKEGLRQPDLILIDGGRGQVNRTFDTLKKLKLDIPLIGLAKVEETIYFPGPRGPLLLPHDSPVLHLLEYVRDESHRFAISYHRRLRRKGIAGNIEDR